MQPGSRSWPNFSDPPRLCGRPSQPHRPAFRSYRRSAVHFEPIAHSGVTRKEHQRGVRGISKHARQGSTVLCRRQMTVRAQPNRKADTPDNEPDLETAQANHQWCSSQLQESYEGLAEKEPLYLEYAHWHLLSGPLQAPCILLPILRKCRTMFHSCLQADCDIQAVLG